MAIFGRPAHWTDATLAHAMTDVDEVKVSIDLHHMDRSVTAEGADTWNIDRVVAAEYHRQSRRAR
jgi:hypothetical protein